MQKQGKLASELGLLGVVVPTEEVALRTAEHVAQRSSCVRGQIGAIALDRMNAVIGVGWNVENQDQFGRVQRCQEHCPRARSSVPSLSSYTEGPGRCISTHAEMAALEDVGTGSRGVAIMVISYTPCPDCMETLRLINGLQVISGTRRTVR